MQSITFTGANFKTGQRGTPWTAADAQLVFDELNGVLTLANITPNGTNGQVATALTEHFAPIVSPSLAGIPLTTNPDGTVANQIATVDYVNQKALQATVGFTPVQQGGATGMGSNKVYLGLSTDGTDQLLAQYDSTPMGPLALKDYTDSTYLKLTGGTLSGPLNVDGAITSVGSSGTWNSVNIGTMGSTNDSYLFFYSSGNTASSDAYIECVGGSTSTGNEGNVTIECGSLTVSSGTTINGNLNVSEVITVDGIYGPSNGLSINYGPSNSYVASYQNDGNLVIYKSGESIFEVGGTSNAINSSIPVSISSTLDVSGNTTVNGSLYVDGASGGINIGSSNSADNPTLFFYSSGNGYSSSDAIIHCTGGSTTANEGNLFLTSSNIILSGNTSIDGNASFSNLSSTIYGPQYMHFNNNGPSADNYIWFHSAGGGSDSACIYADGGTSGVASSGNLSFVATNLTFDVNGGTVNLCNGSGSVIAPTPAASDNSYKVANTSWVTNNFVRPNTSPTFSNIDISNGGALYIGTASIYQDNNGTGDLVFHTTNGGSNYFTVIDDSGDMTVGGSINGGVITGSEIISNGDIHTGTGNWLYTNIINPPSGALTINGGNIVGSGNSVNINYGPENVNKASFQSDGNLVVYDNNTAMFSINSSGSSCESSFTFTNSVSFSGSAGTTQISNAPPDTPGNTGSAVPNTWWVDNYYEPKLGFTPVQQGTGTNQGSNAVKIGWGTGSYAGYLAATVDNTDIGAFAMQSWVNGNYISESQYNSDFSTGDSRVINLPYSHRIQAWSFDLTTSGYTAYVTFPVAFSAGPLAISVESSAGDMDTWTNNWSSTGFTINVPNNSPTTNGNISVIAVGPR